MTPRNEVPRHSTGHTRTEERVSKSIDWLYHRKS